jgi:hypothetical protein
MLLRSASWREATHTVKDVLACLDARASARTGGGEQRFATRGRLEI